MVGHTHLPIFLKKGSFAEMTRRDKKWNNNGVPPVDKDELIAIAHIEEKRILEFETEMRAECKF